MYISQVRTRNFKNLINNVFSFDSHINTIIGENGTGKTNIFQAIRLALDNEYKMYFSEELFSHKVVKQKGHWIIISIEFDQVGESVEEVYLKPKDDGTAKYTVIYRPKKEVRTNLFKMSNDYQKATNDEEKSKFASIISDYLDKIDYKDDYEKIDRVTELFDINDDVLYKKVVGDFTNYIFPDPEEQDNRKIIGNIDQGFRNYVNITFIPAIRNVTSELTGENNFLTRMLKAITENIDPLEWSKFEANIRDVNEGLGNISQFKDFIKYVDATSNRTVGNLYSTNIELQMEIPVARNNLVRYFNLKGKEEDTNISLYNRSLGDNNIIYFALKLVESTMKFGQTKKVLSVMLIEEPEAHVHKFLQESLFKGLKDRANSQLFLSTHSVHISEVSNISTLTVLDKAGNYVVSYKPSNGLPQNDVEYLERYLDATKSSILFSKKVCIVEGTAELLMLPKLYELLYGINFSRHGISIHSIDSSYMEGISKLFHKDRIRKYVSLITDGDKDFREPQSNKEENAKKRLQRLKDLHKDNDFVFISESEYTFEIDFYRINKDLLKSFVIDYDIYKKESVLEEFTCKDNLVLFERIEKLCNLVGKGWLAYRFINWIESNPKYLDKLMIPYYIHAGIASLLISTSTNIECEVILNNIHELIRKKSEHLDNFLDYLEI